MSDLKVDTYTRPARPVIRFTEGGNSRDGHEVVIEITGSLAPSAVEKQRAWARKIKAVEEIEGGCRMAVVAFATLVARLDEKNVAPEVAAVLHECVRHLRAALALLDPPTTHVDGAATGAGPENQETPR